MSVRVPEIAWMPRPRIFWSGSSKRDENSGEHVMMWCGRSPDTVSVTSVSFSPETKTWSDASSNWLSLRSSLCFTRCSKFSTTVGIIASSSVMVLHTVSISCRSSDPAVSCCADHAGSFTTPRSTVTALACTSISRFDSCEKSSTKSSSDPGPWVGSCDLITSSAIRIGSEDPTRTSAVSSCEDRRPAAVALTFKGTGSLTFEPPQPMVQASWPLLALAEGHQARARHSGAL
mmetsp:Transcript_31734/g.72674  ORF Transcript_31734/g.72674 Transcript_31734/m.72674 type:complete len:232 (-) Transcript_31734:7-702(-)